MKFKLTEPKQPSQESWTFVKKLSEPASWNFNWSRQKSHSHEALLSEGVNLQFNFPDPNQSLETANLDLINFFKASGLNLNGSYAIETKFADLECFEAYQLQITANSTTILAGDTEGIRRGIYHLENLLLEADGPFLPVSVISKKPWLKSRISRCFYGPIKRPPFNRDELLDDVDYYPPEYLGFAE